MSDITFRPSGCRFGARIVRKGDRYGAGRSLVHDDKPMVEFYDDTHHSEWADPLGQFISRYYIETLLTDRRPGVGLDLCGYEPQWKIDGLTMDWFVVWLRYEEWRAARQQIYDREAAGEMIPADEWSYSGDDAVDLLNEVMALVNPATPT